MAKVTYLLGAGASVGSLPTVNDFDKEIELIITVLRNYMGNVRDKIAENYTGEKKLLFGAIKDLQMLLEGCKRHRSVDTFARMLFLTSHDEIRATKYNRLKYSITLFFELYHFFKRSTDKRYDAFIATIMDKLPPYFPEDINILSWNYDYEFERAFMNYTTDKQDIHEVYRDLNIVHKNCRASKNIGNNFGIIKLNGTSGFFAENSDIILGLNHWNAISTGIYKIDYSMIVELLENYDLFANQKKLEPAISFSWENDEGVIKVLDEVLGAVTHTQLLVIIGYSFPYFNRKIDQQIFSFMRHTGAKVYIQDPLASNFIETVHELRYWQPNAIKASSNCDQFYMSL